MLKIHKDSEKAEDKTVIFLDVPKELRTFIKDREPYTIQHAYNVIEEALDYFEPSKTDSELRMWLFRRAGEWNRIAGR
jgi:hypothetical protein